MSNSHECTMDQELTDATATVNSLHKEKTILFVVSTVCDVYSGYFVNRAAEIND